MKCGSQVRILFNLFLFFTLNCVEKVDIWGYKKAYFWTLAGDPFLMAGKGADQSVWVSAWGWE